MTPRQRVFSKLVAAGGDPVASAIEAGYRTSTARRTAARLLLASDTKRAIEEAMAGKTEAIANLEAARLLAMTNGDAYAAVLAIRSIARIRGVV
jgi:phage terminase small subunit